MFRLGIHLAGDQGRTRLSSTIPLRWCKVRSCCALLDVLGAASSRPYSKRQIVVDGDALPWRLPDYFGLRPSVWGEQYISSGLTAVLSATLPLFVVILAHASIKAESLTRPKVLGVIVAFAGVAAIFWRDLASAQVSATQFSQLGSLAIVGSAASGAVGNVVAKKYAGGIDPSANTLIQSLVGAASLLAVGIMTERGSALRLEPTVIVAVLYLGVVGSALAFVGWYWLLTKTTATNSSLVLFVTPIVALALGWSVLQEAVEPIVALGTFLILSGVYLTLMQGKRASRSSAYPHVLSTGHQRERTPATIARSKIRSGPIQSSSVLVTKSRHDSSNDVRYSDCSSKYVHHFADDHHS